MFRFFERLGASFLHAAEEIGRMAVLLAQTVAWLVRPPYRGQVFLKQIEYVGIDSLFIIVLTSLFSGMVFSLQSSYALSLFEANEMIGPAVVLSLCRELAPVLTGLLVTARVGSAMAAELGTMRVTEQIDALETLAVNPIQYLIAPRVLAGVLMLPALTTVFNVVGTLGSYFISTFLLDIPPALFMDQVIYYVDFDDFYLGLLKAAFFGLALTLISCYKGFYVRGGAAGVGKATNQAVVISSVTILVSDYFLTAYLYGT